MKFEKLGNIATIKTGKYDVNHSTPDGDYAFYTCAFGQFKSPTYSFEGPSIILPGNGANVGEVFYYDGKFEAYQRTYVVQNFKADPNYIYAYFKYQWKKSLRNKQFGSATNYIRLNNLTDFSIPIPSIPDQHHIANLLSKAKNLIAQRKESIAQLDEFLKSTFLEMFGDPARNDRKWETNSLANFGSFKNGLNYTRNESGISIRCLGVGDFKNLSKLSDIDSLPILNLSSTPSNEYHLKDGDLVFVRSNGNRELVGRCIAVFPKKEKVTFSGFCIRYRIEEDKINSIYLTHLFRVPIFRQSMLENGRGANIQNINQQTLTNLKIITPPLELQTRFAQVVEKTETLKTQYQQSLQELENLYGSLSQRAFKGELTVKTEANLPIAAEMTATYRKESAIPESKKGFAKQVLGGKIVSLFKDDKNFTHIKFQKIQYLAEHIAEEDLLWNYYRQQAGPYDNKFMHNVANKLKQNKWFEEKKFKFHPLQKVNDIERYYGNYFGNKQEKLNELFRLLKNASEKVCEAIATIYAVWNNHIILKQGFDKDKLKTEFFEWSTRKENVFTEKEFEQALTWMQQHNITPTGFGQLIKKKTSK